jgi:hypothetical protein
LSEYAIPPALEKGALTLAEDSVENGARRCERDCVRKSPTLRIQTRLGPRSVLLVGCLLWCFGGTLPTPAQDDQDRFDPLNFAFSAVVGSGIYKSGERTAWVLRAPIRVTVRSVEKHAWGVDVTVPTTLGFFDFKPADLPGSLPSRVGTLTVLPGFEFQLPIFKAWRLMPFANGGPGKDFEGGDLVWVFSGGVSSRLALRVAPVEFVLWNRLAYATNFERQAEAADDLALFDTELNVLGLYRFTVAGRATDMGVYGKNELYFNNVVIQTPTGETFRVESRWEVGLTYGASERWFAWKIQIPRVGLGYRFGEGTSTVVFRLKYRY